MFTRQWRGAASACAQAAKNDPSAGVCDEDPSGEQKPPEVEVAGTTWNKCWGQQRRAELEMYGVSAHTVRIDAYHWFAGWDGKADLSLTTHWSGKTLLCRALLWLQSNKPGVRKIQARTSPEFANFRFTPFSSQGAYETALISGSKAGPVMTDGEHISWRISKLTTAARPCTTAR